MTDHVHSHPHDADEAEQDLAAHWEERYAGADPIWSGRVNATVADIVGRLAPGRALDLGCGEGGDAIWLARHGWQVVGVDISATAIARATAAAADAGLSQEQVRFVAADLSGWDDGDGFDLVSAAFLHSMVDFPRTDVLRQAAGRVRSGGHLLLVTHAAFPPWSDAQQHGHDHDFRLLSPVEEIAALALDPAQWSVELSEVRGRDAVGPDGQSAVLDDGVVLMRRS